MLRALGFEAHGRIQHPDVREKGSHIEVAAQVAFELGVDDVAGLLAVVELAGVLPDGCALPLLRGRHVGGLNGNPMG